MRVGIAGYGLAGRSFHAPLLKGCGFDVSTVLTGNSTRARQAKEDFPLTKVVDSLDEFLRQELDLVVIASANMAHAEQSLAAIKAGIPVVVDKPMGRSAHETELIIAAAEKAGVPVTSFFNRLWDSDALTIKKIVANGLIGKPFRLDSRFERFRPQLNLASWRESESAENGGGLLLDLQTHLLSTAIDWFGPAKLAYANVRSIRGDSEDDVVLNLVHSSGVDSYLAVSAIAGAPGPRIRLLGTEGALIVRKKHFCALVNFPKVEPGVCRQVLRPISNAEILEKRYRQFLEIMDTSISQCAMHLKEKVNGRFQPTKSSRSHESLMRRVK